MHVEIKVSELSRKLMSLYIVSMVFVDDPVSVLVLLFFDNCN